MIALALTMIAAGEGFLVSQRPALLLRPTHRRAFSPCMEEQTVSVTLIDCSDGVGVGLDTQNRVDMLTPGKPGAASLQLGDKIVTWNGVQLMDETGQRRLLKDVVTPADSHELVVERGAFAPPPLDLTKASLDDVEPPPLLKLEDITPPPLLRKEATSVRPGLPERISNIVTDDNDKIEFILGGVAISILFIVVLTGFK